MGNGKGPTTDLTLRNLEISRSLPTGQLHAFRVRPFQGKILEVEDIHFHHDSAVMLPDSGDLPGLQDPSDENHISGLDVLRACYLHAQRMPSNLALIAGHTDRSGKDDYNLKLSQLRADNVFFLLMGNKKAWVDICHEKHKTEDIQQILIWVTAVIGWPCDPGPKNNQMNGKTVAAIRAFQTTYKEKVATIGVDGEVGKETWGAFYDAYMMRLREIMKTDDAGLERLRSAIKYVDDSKKSVGCGENFPLTEDLVANQKSQVDRRVHVLFFDPPDVPKLDCHPGAGKCEAAVCELYGSNRIYTFKPLPKEPEAIARNFRVRLEYGDIDRLFRPVSSPVSTDFGIRARLQAVGFLYELVTEGAPVKAVAPVAWEHFKTQEGAASDAVAAERLKDMLAEVILDNNILPEPGAFGKIRLPGTWCPADTVFLMNPPSGQPHYRYAKEDIIWSDNAGLGLIPIVAVVEQEKGGAWGPAPKGIQVHFQLIPPDDVPADKAPPVLRSTTIVSEMGASTFRMTGSPKVYVDGERQRNPKTAGDPQVDNAHQKVGGKRGNPVAGGDRGKNVLQTGVTIKGFHDHFSFDVPKKSSHPDAIAAATNDQGKAAMILMPARTGGDRYRIRAFLDPIPEPGEDQPSDGTEELAVKAETGTLVVWRILRFSKYLRWDYPGPGVDAGDAAHKTTCGGDLNDFDITGVIAKEYSKAWLDVSVESLAASPQKISQAEWRSAIQFARGKFTRSLSQKYDLGALVPDTTSTAGVHNNNPGLIRFRTAAQYDAVRASSFPRAPAQNTFFADMSIVMHTMKEDIMEYFTRNALAGLTVIQVPLMCSFETDSLTLLKTLPNASDWGRSGWGGFRRGCYVAYGKDVYKSPRFPYDHNRNTMHETGHTLYCPHQYEVATAVSNGRGVGVTTGGVAEHDFHDMCVMGYMDTWPGGDFCGRCLLMFAGWDIHGIPANSPGP